MQSLITRFHLLVFGITLAMAGVGFYNIPEDFEFPAHFTRSTADWVWPRDDALIVPLALQALVIGCFFVLGRLLTKNHFAKTQHLFEPAIRLILLVIAGCQFGFLLIGSGSDLNFFRVIGAGLAALLVVLSVVLFEAERHSYAGMRMPWPIPSDRAWVIVHRGTAIACAFAAVALAWQVWADLGLGVLVQHISATIIGLPIIAGVLSLLTARMS